MIHQAKPIAQMFTVEPSLRFALRCKLSKAIHQSRKNATDDCIAKKGSGLFKARGFSLFRSYSLLIRRKSPRHTSTNGKFQHKSSETFVREWQGNVSILFSSKPLTSG